MSCSPAMRDGKMVAGLTAGGHLDPAHTGKHEGPWGNGHLGELFKKFLSDISIT